MVWRKLRIWFESGVITSSISTVLLIIFALFDAIAPRLGLFGEQMQGLVNSVTIGEKLIIILFGYSLSAQQNIRFRLRHQERSVLLTDNIHNTMSRYVPRTIKEQYLRDQEYKGLHSIHNDLSLEYIRELMKGAKNFKILLTYSPNLEALRRNIIQALDNGGMVQILLLHPRSELANYRTNALQKKHGLEEESSTRNVRAGITGNLETLEYIYQHVENPINKQNLHVRLYDSLPSVSMYIIDNCYLVGFYLHERLAIETPQLEFFTQFESDTSMTSSILTENFAREFEIVWSTAQTIRPDHWQDDTGRAFRSRQA